MSDKKEIAEAPEAPEWKDSFLQIKREGVIFNLSSNPGSPDGTYLKGVAKMLIKAHALKGTPALMEEKELSADEKKRRAKINDERLTPTGYYLYTAAGSPMTVLAPLTTDGGEELEQAREDNKGVSQEIQELSKKLQDVKDASSKAVTTAKDAADAKLQELKDKQAIEVAELKAVIKGLNTKKTSLVKLINEFFKPKK